MVRLSIYRYYRSWSPASVIDQKDSSNWSMSCPRDSFSCAWAYHCNKERPLLTLCRSSCGQEEVCSTCSCDVKPFDPAMAAAALFFFILLLLGGETTAVAWENSSDAYFPLSSFYLVVPGRDHQECFSRYISRWSSPVRPDSSRAVRSIASIPKAKVGERSCFEARSRSDGSMGPIWS